MSDGHAIEDDSGTVQIPAGTLAALVTRAAESAGAVHVRRRGVEVGVAGDIASVRIDVDAAHGVVLQGVGRDVQRAVADTLRTMCALEATVVDVHVEELT
jgi:uncharacterized alkaline shock family protein YloU